MPEQAKTFDYESEIWNIADYLRDVIKRSEYNRVVLPFSLLRRLECALEPTRDAVSASVAEHEMEWGRESDNYCKASGKPFYNVTTFRLNNLGATDTYEALMQYINGFSPNARDILVRFRMEETCKKLDEHGMLYEVCRRFSAFDMSPETLSDREMSNIYEHLIQRYGEAIVEAAEDFMTPKDVVRLAVSMIFANDDDLFNNDEGAVRTLYDPTAGTGGFICDALDMLDEWHKEKQMTAPAVIVPYGQEIESESWAVCKANLLLRNVSNLDKDEADSIKDMSAHIEYGDTLADDKTDGNVFDYTLSNPPYGKKWELSQSAVMDEAKLGFKGRFGAGLPPIDDGSMLFLQHVVSKMDPVKGKAGIVLSASPLFSGKAGSGESNIRRWLFQQDVIDCIVKLPAGVFFRTSINTYLWILSNRKEKSRKGYVQLIDASDMKTLLKTNLGKKRFEISTDQRDWIVQTYMDGTDNDKSVMVPVEDFMYREVTTQQPLHMKIVISADKMDEFKEQGAFTKLSESGRTTVYQELMALADTELDYGWADSFSKAVLKKVEKPKPGASALAKSIVNVFGVRDDRYPVVVDTKKGTIVPDSDKKDSERIPYTMDFDSYMETEVLPFAPETWIDETVVDKGPLQDGQVGVVGTEISFNRYFYQYTEPRKPEDILKDIALLDTELLSLMGDLLK